MSMIIKVDDIVIQAGSDPCKSKLVVSVLLLSLLIKHTIIKTPSRARGSGRPEGVGFPLRNN